MILALTVPALMWLLPQLFPGLFTALSGTQWPVQLTSKKSPAMNRDKDAAVHMQPSSGSGVEYREQTQKREEQYVHVENIPNIYSDYVFSQTFGRHPSSSLSFRYSHHLISLTLITLLLSQFTHASVIFCHPRGSFPVSPVSSRLNKVVCKLTDRLSPVTTSHWKNEPEYRWIRHLWTHIWWRK